MTVDRSDHAVTAACLDEAPRCSAARGATQIQPSTWWQVWWKVRQLALTPEQLVTPLMRRPPKPRWPPFGYLNCSGKVDDPYRRRCGCAFFGLAGRATPPGSGDDGFYRDVLQLEVILERPGATWFRLEDGAEVRPNR
jgi:hypothetical protein